MPNTPKVNNLSENSIDKLLNNQTKQLELQEKEQNLKAIELAKSYDYAEKALNAQKETMLQEMADKKIDSTKKYLFSGFALVVVLGVSAYLSLNGQKEIAEKLFTVLTTAVTTGVGGYFAGFQMGKNQRNTDTN